MRPGFVFQDFALFPHLTVAKNIAFGMSLRHTPAANMANRVEELLQRMRLDGPGVRLGLAESPAPGEHRLLLRPSSARIVCGDGPLRAKVTRSVFVGDAFQVTLRFPFGGTLEVRHPEPPPAEVAVEKDPTRVHFIA